MTTGIANDVYLCLDQSDLATLIAALEYHRNEMRSALDRHAYKPAMANRLAELIAADASLLISLHAQSR
jgi:hypothetical protein